MKLYVNICLDYILRVKVFTFSQQLSIKFIKIIIIIFCKSIKIISHSNFTEFILYTILMKNSFTQKLDPDQIRQGLLNIRNTQLQLLNQLKYQTDILKHYSPPSTSSEHSQILSFDRKWNHFSPSVLQSQSNHQHIAKLSQSDLLLNTSNDKNLREEINYLKNENKLLSANIQKIKKSVLNDKETISELQGMLQITSKIYYEALIQILQDVKLKEVKQFILSKINQISHTKNRLKNYFDEILILLNEKSKQKQVSTKLKVKTEGENDIANQLIDLKSQISLLINNSNQNVNNSNQLQLSKIKQEVQERNATIENSQNMIRKLEKQNKDINNRWQKELNQRKKLMIEWEKIKKQSNSWEQKQKKIIFYAKDMQNRALKAEKAYHQKQNSQFILKENISKLSQTVRLIRESNENLKDELKSLQFSSEKKYQLLFEQKKNIQNQLIITKLDKQKYIQNKEMQLFSLKNHIAEIKKNEQSLKEYDKKNRENEAIQQQIYWRKVNIVRTNSTIDHLWKVKEVQYENIHDILVKIKK